MTTKERYLNDIEDNFLSSLETIKAKGADYATEADPFQNFRAAAEFAGVGIERAMLVRIGDKWGRFKNLLAKEEAGARILNEVSDETAEDTLRDLLGYTNILAVYRDWKRKSVEGYLFSGVPEDYEFIPEGSHLITEEEIIQQQEEEPPAEEETVEPPTAPVEPHVLSAREKLLSLLKRG